MFYFYLLLTVIFWGSAPIFDKYVLSKGLSPLIVTTVRSIVLALMLGAAVAVSGRYEGLRQLNWKLLSLIAISGLLGGGLGQLTYYMALKSERAALVVPLAAAYPVVTMLLGISFLGEALTLWRTVGVLLVLAGAILVKVG